MTEHRKGEQGIEIPRRSPRVFQKADGFWYFMTREKTEVGPYPTDEAATDGVNDYAGFSQDVDRVYLEDIGTPVGESLDDLAALQRQDAPVDIESLPGERMVDTQETAAERRARLFSSRLFFRDGGWYFFTREGRDVGPFPVREEAELAIEKYVGFASDLDRVIRDAYEEDASRVQGADDEDHFLS